MIEKFRTSPPKVLFKIKCWHPKDGSETDKIVTHTAEEPYRFAEWMDQSPSSSLINYVNNYRAIRFDVGIHLEYGPQAQASYDFQKYDFKRRNHRDSRQDFEEKETIEDLHKHVLIINNEKGGLPWYCNTGVFWFCNILMFNWLYKIIFVSLTERATFKYNKLIMK